MVSSSADAQASNLNVTQESCTLKYEDYVYPSAELYCNWTWDSLMCWPPTIAGNMTKQKCPPIHGFDATKYVERRCSLSGHWEAKLAGLHNQTNNNGRGWTNYTICFTPEMSELWNKVHEGNPAEILVIANRTRVLEMVGFSISWVALLLSLIIFCRFRSLRNNRTRIHKNLFIAMFIQVIIRLTLYVDQAVIRHGSPSDQMHGIDNTRYLCEASYVMLEYARTAMFMWMFIEGLYLHNVVTLTVFQERFPHRLYTALGWVGPLLLTITWTAIMTYHKYGQKCWWGYSFTSYYWILEGPRLAVILLNFFFLLNILRVLVIKLRQSHTSDLEQVRKAVRAAIVLLPLLGITNLLNMVQAPLSKPSWRFAVWSYTTHTLTSFQGFLIALIYCFMNGEVRAVLQKNLHVYMSVRGYADWAPRRPSMFSAAYVTAPETEAPHTHQHSAAHLSARTTNSHQEIHSRPEPSVRRPCNKWLSTLCFRSRKEVTKATSNKCPMATACGILQHGTPNPTNPTNSSTTATTTNIGTAAPMHPSLHQSHLHHHHHHHHNHHLRAPIAKASPGTGTTTSTASATTKSNALPPETCV